ncbi:hypothetical protein J2X56_001132 [Herbaspirillum sp. 1173]|uniref:YagK/YfjJ domain-containing protein n=1 Tax=Herbaspirillum sp. 1173 TaxID=2817734 RepID=UPI0028545292|nr:inovirus-type Gp2 protein [Herbaspirillum sp. 1173]MDR6739146.1 hypothetical protein [Herbaspirillum sp. 1173]
MSYLVESVSLRSLTLELQLNQKNNEERTQNSAFYFRDVDRQLHTVSTQTKNLHIKTDFAERLSALVKFMTEVVYGKDVPYAFIEKLHGEKTLIMARGKPIAGFFPMLQALNQIYATDLYFSPLLRLFFESYQEHVQIRECMEFWPNKKVDCVADRAQVFNDFVDYMRQRAKAMQLKSAIADWERNAKNNCDRLNRYIPALFEQDSRLVFIRVDLGYQSSKLTPQEAEAAIERIVAEQGRETVDIEASPESADPDVGIRRGGIKEILLDRKRLMTNLRKKTSLFKHLVGYILRIECGRDGGHHIHAAFIFGESQVRQHAWLAQQIGVYWVQDITKGRGHFHNCHYNDYPDYVIGIVNYYETDKRERLMEKLSYLAKRDQFVHVKPSKRGKMFTTGHLPKVKSTRPGRPRKKSDVTKKVISEMLPKGISQMVPSQVQPWIAPTSMESKPETSEARQSLSRCVDDESWRTASMGKNTRRTSW